MNEGWPGFALDCYGPMALLQCFRERPEGLAFEPLESWLQERLGVEFLVVWLRRRGQPPDLLYGVTQEIIAREAGIQFRLSTHHPGQDPHLFLDLRSTRRHVRHQAAGKRVLNLFAYTCGVGLAAEAGGAEQVVNVDFSESALARGASNAALNGFVRQQFWREEALPILWQLAGRKLPRRPGKPPLQVEPGQFDLVVIDPPQRSKGRFGSTDLANDYQSLFRPAWEFGSSVLAVNNLAGLALDEFRTQLERCAARSGRPLQQVEVIAPDLDFPSPDGRPPLKVLSCR